MWELRFFKSIALAVMFFLAVFLWACAPMQNLSVEDVRTPNKLVREGRINMPLEMATYCSQKTIYNCGQGVSISINPDDNKLGTIFVHGMGLTQANPYIIVDIADMGDHCVYKGYSAMLTWNSLIDRYIQMINNCGKCE